MSIFFTADEHHGHENIIRFCKRPFSGIEEMTEKLVTNHNEVVKPGDHVFHLGDMFWRTFGLDPALKLMARLNGRHFYIYGNHCELFRHKELRDCFEWCKDVDNLKVQGYPNIWLSHYAHRVWNGSHRGAYHVYGHTHNVLPEGDYLSTDVGVDAQNFYPISLEDLDKKLKARKGRFDGGQWVCECGNKFLATNTSPTVCAKCTKEMRLV
jgi:calcineurin-like phosphoesterase family protein